MWRCTISFPGTQCGVRYILSLALGCAALIAAAAGHASAPSGTLRAKPNAAAVTAFPRGITPLANGALVYRPASAPDGAAPLLVILHGAGHGARPFLDLLMPKANQGGLLLLALQSKDATWDLVPRNGKPPRFGDDVARIDAVLKQVFSNAAVDPNRIVLLGFSDGAGYALSLGLANPRLFRGIVALSPGFVVPPPSASPRQRIFVAHGVRDPVLPFRHSETVVVGLMEQAGARPLFRRHNGGHVIDSETLDAGLAYALRGRER
jgi:phospholipase/carboxylesterase